MPGLRCTGCRRTVGKKSAGYVMDKDPAKLASLRQEADGECVRPDTSPDFTSRVALSRRVRISCGPWAWYIGLAVALLITALGWVALRGIGYQRLTADSPSYQVDHILSLRLVGGSSARFRVELVDAQHGGEPMLHAVPPYLQLASPIYDLHVRGPGRLDMMFSVPEASDAVSLPDLYRWNPASRRWEFLPSRIDPLTGLRASAPPSGPVALFQVAGISPLVGAVIEPGQAVDPARLEPLNLLLVGGAEVQVDGTLGLDQLPEQVALAEDSAGLIVITMPQQEVRNAILTGRALRQAHLRAIVESIDLLGASGVILDYGPFEEAQVDPFYRLLGDLHRLLADSDRLVAIRVPTPLESNGEWDTQGYDWPHLAALADLIVVTPPGNPSDYRTDGATGRFMAWATGQINRAQLLIATSSLSVDEWGDLLTPISYEYALAPLGTVALQREEDSPIFSPRPGDPLAFNLRGDSVNLGPSDGTQVFHYDVYTGDGLHTIWLVTAAALRSRLEWLAAYRIGGIVIEDLFSEGHGPGIETAIEEFQTRRPSTLNPALTVRWMVESASGAMVADAAIDLGTPLVWTPTEEGEYVVRASLVGQEDSDRGATAIIVGGDNVGVVPSAEAIVVGAPSLPSDQPTSVPIPEGMPPPVVPAGAVGNFALGGQVNHVINDPVRMREAGMTWVKFQLAWAEDMDPSIAWTLIQQGRQNRMHVLLSINGQVKYPSSINIPAYLEFLRGVAYYGPDAIEVWNEQNLDFEWPHGQIDGGRYTREMLAPAYNAIKEINPNIMVISGALAPTGAFFGDGGCSALGSGCDDWLYLQQMAQAGAANYMDCVGTHFNSGATPPSASTGHPADPGYQHYSWYYGGMLQLYGGTFGRPVCFTELGYLSGEGYGGVPPRYSWAQDTTVAEQAQWLAEAVQMSKQSRQVRLLIVWNFDFTYWGDDPMAGYAIVRPDGSCPACRALDDVMP